MERAAQDLYGAWPVVLDRRQELTFKAEAIPIWWFYRTARTHANFYDSCQIRDEVVALSKKPNLSAQEKAGALAKIERWQEILQDEKENTREAIPYIQLDMRLDPYYGGDHTFPHGIKMIEAKLDLLDEERHEYLASPSKEFAK